MPPYAFLNRCDLVREFESNIEANYAALADRSFEHELAYNARPFYFILAAGGFDMGGFNFEAKLRRQSARTDALEDLSHIAKEKNLDPKPPSGRQEMLENLFSRYLGLNGERPRVKRGGSNVDGS